MEALSQIGPLPTEGAIIRWWELRRVVFNLAILFVGLAALYAFEGIMAKIIPEGEDAIEPLGIALGATGYILVANLFYTCGWIFEARARRKDPVEARKRAKSLFWRGTLFFCSLPTLPFWFACAYWLTHRA
jgi:hypothetical protein